jgi:hypothetical protein
VGGPISFCMCSLTVVVASCVSCQAPWPEGVRCRWYETEVFEGTDYFCSTEEADLQRLEDFFWTTFMFRWPGWPHSVIVNACLSLSVYGIWLAVACRQRLIVITCAGMTQMGLPGGCRGPRSSSIFFVLFRATEHGQIRLQKMAGDMRDSIDNYFYMCSIGHSLSSAFCICFVVSSPVLGFVGVPRVPEDGKFELSSRERGPSVRSLHGLWWNNIWKATKVLYARFPDGTRKASSLGSGVLVMCGFRCAACKLSSMVQEIYLDGF